MEKAEKLDYQALGILDCNKATDKPFKINCCGAQAFSGAKSYDGVQEVSYPDGRADYLMLFVTSGSCIARANADSHILTPNDMLLYRPNEPQLITFERKTKCNAFWIHFSGTAVENMLKDVGLEEGNLFHLSDIAAIEAIHIKLMIEAQARKSGWEMFALAYFQLILAMIYRALPINEQSNRAVTDERLVNVLSIMDKSFNLDCDIDHYAKLCGVGRDRFMHIFKQAVGVSPKKYVIDLRIKNAQRLLEGSKLPVGEVAELCGFHDPLYFSRVFRSYTGISPLKYRHISVIDR